MGILSRERDVQVLGTAWPLAARAAAGLSSPAGDGLLRRALEGAALDRGSRVVHMEPGLGIGARAVLDAVPRAWTGVEPDPLAADHLRGALGAAGRQVRHAAPEATGLDDGAATLVVVEGALSLRSDDEAAELLAEVARLLATAGRVAVVEPVAAGPGADVGALDDAGVRARPVDALRRMVTAAGLVVVGALDGPLRLRPPHELARAAGPRLAMRLARGATDERVRHAATTVRQALDEASPRLRAGAVVAERPLVMGLRRPR